MSVGFRCGSIWTEFGNSDLLHSFFSTISYRLESNEWGSKYPYLQKKFYFEKLESQDVQNAFDELKDIKEKFSKLKVEDIVWDVEDLSKQPPTWFFSQLNATNLSKCFVGVRGREIFETLSEIFEYCIKRHITVLIQSERDLIK